VDDDELVRWCAAEGLREKGYSVAVAASAREALRGCREAAVALLDDDLPGVDGLTIAERLRRRHPRCAVVLMTADPTPELRRRARQEGVARILGKPFSLEGLVGAIQDALEHVPCPRPHPAAEPNDDEGDRS
jgi:CheY-like chemotaxis protein